MRDIDGTGEYAVMMYTEMGTALGFLRKAEMGISAEEAEALPVVTFHNVHDAYRHAEGNLKMVPVLERAKGTPRFTCTYEHRRGGCVFEPKLSVDGLVAEVVDLHQEREKMAVEARDAKMPAPSLCFVLMHTI
ncbi:hypothetical protein JXB11_02450 [Candidatus Woesearchaeota archaeon]|nr:hypothetical protein [Candidatus Woesearchaeota archaeon]